MSGKAEEIPLFGAGQAESTQPGGVDEHSASGHLDQLASNRGVPAAAVTHAHLASRLTLLAEQHVDERGLAGARRTDEYRGPVARHVTAKRLEALGGKGVGDDDLRAERDRCGRCSRTFDVGREVGFVSTTTGTAPDSQARESSRSRRRRFGGSAMGCTTNTTSMLAAITWTSEVLPGSPRVMALARGSTASIKGNIKLVVDTRGHPIADRRQLRWTCRGLQQAGAGLGASDAARRRHEDAAAVAADHARRDAAAGGVGLEQIRPAF